MKYWNRVVQIVGMSVVLNCAELSAVFDLPLVEIDGSGNAVAVWADQDGTGINVIQGSLKPINGTWSSTLQISANGLDSGSPKLVVNSAGVACAAWIVKDPTLGIRSLYAAILPSGGSWGDAIRVSGSDCHVYDFSLRISSSGDVVATWNAALVSNDTRAIATATAPCGGSWGSPQILTSQ